jgi:hypothetical protein
MFFRGQKRGQKSTKNRSFLDPLFYEVQKGSFLAKKRHFWGFQIPKDSQGFWFKSEFSLEIPFGGPPKMTTWPKPDFLTAHAGSFF